MPFNIPRIDFTAFKFTNFNFRDKEKDDSVFSFVRKLVGVEGRRSPLRPRWLKPKSPLITRKKEPEITRLGEAIGLNKFISTDVLNYHQERLEKEYTIRFNVYMLTALILFFSPVILIIYYSTNALSNLSFFFSVLLSILFVIVSLLYFFVAAGIALLFSQFITLRYFSDSLCVEMVVFLIVELARCSNPMSQFDKKRLLTRTNFLVKATHFLTYQYNLDAKTFTWATNHFQQIESFIKDREKWIVAPKDSTLADLQQDIYQLALIYISGNFGNFEYETSTPSNSEGISNNSFKNFLLGIPRISIGIILPLLVLLISSLRPELFSNIIDIKVLALICIGWLLLAIDVILKLGVVSSVIEVAKGIKELT